MRLSIRPITGGSVPVVQAVLVLSWMLPRSYRATLPCPPQSIAGGEEGWGEEEADA